MVGQCHRSDQHEFDLTPGGSGRQEGLACSGPWGHEESDTTKQLNNNDHNILKGCFGLNEVLKPQYECKICSGERYMLFNLSDKLRLPCPLHRMQPRKPIFQFPNLFLGTCNLRKKR